jgi:serine/threonine-protein kinase
MPLVAAAALVPSPAPPTKLEAELVGAAPAPVPLPASDDGPKPPLFSEDFSRGLRRWSRQPFPDTVRHEYEIVELEGNPVLRLSHQAPQGEVGAFLSVNPRRHEVSPTSRVWLEADVRVTRLEPVHEQHGDTREDSRGMGAGLLLQVLLSVEPDGHSYTVLVDLGSLAGRSASTGEWGNLVYPLPIRPGQHVHVKVGLGALLARQRLGSIQRVERIGLLAYGANVEAFVDNLSLVEE